MNSSNVLVNAKTICRLFEKSNDVISPSDSIYYVQRSENANSKILFLDQSIDKQQGMISDMLNVFYGVSYANISGALVDAIRTKILTSFPKLSIADFQTSFNRKEIVKRQGVAMTLNEFFEPINEWINVCNRVSTRINREIDRENEEKRREEESLKVYKKEQQEMLQLFERLKAEKKTVWPEIDVHALKISKIVSKGIVSDEEKIKIYNDMVNYEMEKQKKENPLSKTDYFLQMLESPEMSSWDIKFKCAVVVVERVLKYYAEK